MLKAFIVLEQLYQYKEADIALNSSHVQHGHTLHRNMISPGLDLQFCICTIIPELIAKQGYWILCIYMKETYLGRPRNWSALLWSPT